ncbi:bifunctional [glutamine synthetase] adenylyltransferase/[glutamine synthetase]-adenylyl-L-tyrosine phosphorylase [Arcanobacterium hippocoleae]|uniref:bifunctional [glutamine synthetase] adenylyltransferase/[glutamine synthetase]-adenylyl-L-tyrosine phosphorylase n=1 Tax=Arcanobacterium hippocoleae TaxID=149017 RepID=UPI0033424107
MSVAADPDAALLAFLRLSEAAKTKGEKSQAALQEICADENAAKALFQVLGYSLALSEFLIAHPLAVTIFHSAQMADSPFATTPEQERELAFQALADYQDAFASNSEICRLAIAALRKHYWQRMSQIVAIDFAMPNSVHEFSVISRAISHLVDAVLAGALEIAQNIVPGGHQIDFAVVAMGKAGAQEINYISDVDLLYIAAPGAQAQQSAEPISESEVIAIGSKIAAELARIVGAAGAIPALWEIDLNLRPEGKDGPLVRTLESYLQYYQNWAKGWEFQALLKARPAAGCTELATALIKGVNEQVWNVAESENFVESSQAMRRRVLAHIPQRDADRQLKLGKGGLRDIEFTVQLLQLVHGRTDKSLRVRSTLEAIDRLSDGGYISRVHATQLTDHYKFLRTLEHRIQVRRFRRSQLVPTSAAELNVIARSLRGSLAGITNGAALEKYWQEIRVKVRALHLELYYLPLIPAVAQLSQAEVTLQPQAAQARLAAIGYRDPQGALAQIQALTAGVSRTAMIQRHLLPVLIGWFGNGPDPDQGLRSFRILSEQMGATSWYLRTLRDSSVAAKRLAQLLSCAKYAAQELPKLSEAIAWLDSDDLLQPRSAKELQEELNAILARKNTPAEIATAGRYLRRKEFLRTAMAQVLGLIDEAQVQTALCNSAEVAIEAALHAASIKLCQIHDLPQLPFEFAVIAMGRFGGKELSYASDADVLLIHRALDHDAVNIDLLANEYARELVQYLSVGSTEPALAIDASLRPEGKNGPLSRSFASYQQYYSRWVDTWERQALVRARYCGGSAQLGSEFMNLAHSVCYRENGLAAKEIREIRMLKARMEAERIPSGIDRKRHLKLGPGGLSDIEWTAQFLQLCHGQKNQQLRTPSTIQALQAANKAELLDHTDTQILYDAWIFASRVRDANFLGTARTQATKIDVLPLDAIEYATVAAILGYPMHQRLELNEDYLRLARNARSITERIFFGDNNEIEPSN